MKIYKYKIPIAMWIAGILLFSYQVRTTTISTIANINFLVYVGLLYGLNKKYYKLEGISKATNKLLIGLYFIIGIGLIFLVKGNGWPFFHKIKMVLTFVTPAVFLLLGNSNDEAMERVYTDIWHKYLRIACYVMTIVYIGDSISGKPLQRFLVGFFNSASVNLKEGRFISIYGHPLRTTMIFFAFLVWTLIQNQSKTNNALYLVDVAIAVFGIAICGSKSGILLAMILITICHFGLDVKKIKYMVGIIILLVILYYSGVFDIVLNRILFGISTGDLSSNRNTALETLLNAGQLQFQWLHGHSIDYSNHKMIFALEYPLLRFAYVNGILFAILVAVMYFVMPILRLFKARQWQILICILFFMIYVNGNSGIASYNDDLLFYAINVGLMLILAKTRKKHSCMPIK